MSQREGLIAVNYAARKYGINRMCTVQDAKKLCPDLISQHVATWKEGDETWAYHPDAAANIHTHKVSLDPYRLESRKILSLIKGCLPPSMQRVEKAGIDEVFIDLSAQVHSIMLQRFPELAGGPPHGDPNEKLPCPSVFALDWQADALVDLDADEGDAEADDPDWDDVAILIGSELIRRIRSAVRQKLRYTTSAGIANNKMLSKLGSGHKKPNQQTVVRSRAAQHFLSDLVADFTRIRNLGGKLGDQVAQVFDTKEVKKLLLVPLEQLKSKLGDDTGIWVYNTIRGTDTSEVTARTQIKSMLSTKVFRPGINKFEQGVKWLRIFAGDIFSRLVEEGVLENKRRPKTISLHYRHGGVTRSRQSPIPQGRALTDEILFDLAKSLLSQIVLEGNIWPCSNLSLTVAGFEDGITGNMGISAFLLKREEVQASKTRSRTSPPEQAGQQLGEKRQRLDNGGTRHFFAKQESPRDPSDVLDLSNASAMIPSGSEDADGLSHQPLTNLDENSGELEGDIGPQRENAMRQTPITDYVCSRCQARLVTPEARQNHEDWHMAKDIQDEERVRSAFAGRTATPTSNSHTSRKKRPTASLKQAGRPSKKGEAGQSKLRFG